MSLRDSQVRQLASKGRRGRVVARLAGDPNRFLAAVQIGVTLAGFLSAAFGAATLAGDLAPVLVERLGLAPAAADLLALVGVTLLITYCSLVFSELAPKRLALQRAETISMLVARPLDAFATLARPVIWVLSKSTDVVVRLLGGDPHARGEAITEEELRGLVAAHESLTADERRLIDDVFAAGERQVREVMLPRTEVEFLDHSWTVGKAAKVALDSPHSRFPVVRGSNDEVVGFVHVRDVLTLGEEERRAATVGEVARDVKMLPGSKRVLVALSEMRREGHHLAVVADEYGGTAGIVTLEDLIEEVIGDIRDEYDEGEVADDQSGAEREVDGLLHLEEFAERTGVHVPEGPYETVAGYVQTALGRVAVVGDAVEADAARLTVLELDGRRIARLQVDRVEAADDGDGHGRDGGDGGPVGRRGSHAVPAPEAEVPPSSGRGEHRGPGRPAGEPSRETASVRVTSDRT